MSEAEQRLLDKMTELEHKAQISKSPLTPDITDACKLLLRYAEETREFKLAAMVGLAQDNASQTTETSRWETSAFRCYMAE